ncbi:MAG: Nuclear protein SET [Candidatus Roizmanbacteria bacterium GW2011_GWB1_40_7]|uniref:Nuclear protein SET n=2 Tax=Candidatus Roizmaniibacteriota TaxID=1752723 RepID=A0A0G0TA10_9BACT|nr:MAG: Nuclear protein SET [Candidatus Roizmanbacteria bacterium GW2011_GWB1_40_7]KKR92813.1 MAG: Nuclear protein SET [Candidatus Roizmanbacteria bacterium GW2011_GWA1_41_13]
MIYIKYKLDKSKFHGIGLFTDEDLKKGQLVYTASPLLDVNITREQFDQLDEKEKREIEYWGFWDEPNNLWHVDFDVSKFINHSYEPTLTQDQNHQDAYLITTKNLKAGEELTQNYLEFETEEDLIKREIQAK